MDIRVIENNGVKVASVKGEGKLLTDTQSALDLIADVRHATGCDRMTLDKASVIDGFFVLSTGIAGDILQKFVNYQMKLAVYGDFTGYTSKPLRDFIYESNRGCDIFFTATEQESISKLAAV